MKVSKLPLSGPIEVVQSDTINQQFIWNDKPETTVAVKGQLRHGLKVVNRGGRLTLSGRLGRPGRQQITITEKRTTTFTVNVVPAKSRWNTPLPKLFMGRRVPAQAPAKSLSSPESGLLLKLPLTMRYGAPEHDPA